MPLINWRKKKPMLIDEEMLDQPIFVIGCGRSGTSLLFSLLKVHPGLAATIGHPDGEDHTGWIAHGGAVMSGLYGHPGKNDHGSVVGGVCCPHMTASDVTDDIRHSMRNYYAQDIIAGRTDLRVINKNPHLSNKLDYVRAIFPKAKFIHIIREPIAMVASWLAIMKLLPELVLYWPETPMPCFWVLQKEIHFKNSTPFKNDDRFYPGAGWFRFADYFSEVNANIDKQKAATEDDILLVHYEHLIQDPLSTLNRIAKFCNLTPFETVSLPVDKERHKAHRELLTSEKRDKVRSHVEDTAIHFGYEWSSEIDRFHLKHPLP